MQKLGSYNTDYQTLCWTKAIFNTNISVKMQVFAAGLFTLGLTNKKWSIYLLPSVKFAFALTGKKQKPGESSTEAFDN